jgi:hypothetical protein
LVAEGVINLAVVPDSGFAKLAFSAGYVRADGNVVAHLKFRNILSRRDNLAGTLVPDDLRGMYARVAVMKDSYIRAAHGTGVNFNDYAVVIANWVGYFLYFDLVFAEVDCRFHGIPFCCVNY